MSMIVNVPTGTTSVESISGNPLMQGISGTASVNFDQLLRQCYAAAGQTDARKESSSAASSDRAPKESAKKSASGSDVTAKQQSSNKSASAAEDQMQVKSADQVRKKDAAPGRKSEAQVSEKASNRPQKERLSDAEDLPKEAVEAPLSVRRDIASKDITVDAETAAAVVAEASAIVQSDARLNSGDAQNASELPVSAEIETQPAEPVVAASDMPLEESSDIANIEESAAYIQISEGENSAGDLGFFSNPGEILSMLRESRSVSSECVAQQNGMTVSASELAASARSNAEMPNDAAEAIAEDGNIELSQPVQEAAAAAIGETQSDEADEAILRQLLARSSGIKAENSKASAAAESADMPSDSSFDAVTSAASGVEDSSLSNNQSGNGAASDNRETYQSAVPANVSQAKTQASDGGEAAKAVETSANSVTDESESSGRFVAVDENVPVGNHVLKDRAAAAPENQTALHEELRAVSSDYQTARQAQDPAKNLQASDSKAADAANISDENADELSEGKNSVLGEVLPNDGEDGESSPNAAGKDVFQKSFVATLREAMLSGRGAKEVSDSPARNVIQDVRPQAESGMSSVSSGSFAESNADSSVVAKGVSDISAAQPMDKALNAKQLNALEAAKEMQKPLRVSQSYEENARQISEKINIMIARNLKTAEVNLDPLNLGKMRININMSDEGVAKVGMVVQNAETKDVIYESLGKLKEALQEAGIKLGDADVKHDDGRGAQASQNEGGSQTNENHSGKMAGAVADESANEQIEAEIVADDLSSAVNYYA